MKYLYNHTSPETAYYVDDYPWGFRLRTQVRYWVESKNNFGERFVKQTLNPKTGRWCAPKKSTYSEVVILTLNDEGHVNYTCAPVGCHRTDEEAQEAIKKFVERHKDNLTDFQKDQINQIHAYNEIMKHVTFKVTVSEYGSVDLMSNDPEEIEKRKKIQAEQEERKKKNDEQQQKIVSAINHEYRTNKIV